MADFFEFFVPFSEYWNFNNISADLQISDIPVLKDGNIT